MLVDLVGTVDGLIGEQEAFIQSVTDQMAKLIADRIADIDAVGARIAELIRLLEGGPDDPIDLEARAPLEAELLELLDLFDMLAPERAALVAGITDGTTLETNIRVLTEARTDATELLEQMQRDKAGFETRLTENGSEQQAQSEAQNAALDEAERILGLAVGAGCEWATGEPERPRRTRRRPEEPESQRSRRKRRNPNSRRNRRNRKNPKNRRRGPDQDEDPVDDEEPEESTRGTRGTDRRGRTGQAVARTIGRVATSTVTSTIAANTTTVSCTGKTLIAMPTSTTGAVIAVSNLYAEQQIVLRGARSEA